MIKFLKKKFEVYMFNRRQCYPHNNRSRHKKPAVPKVLYHGTVMGVALDIFDNRRFKVGERDRFWLTCDFREAECYADDRVLELGGRPAVVELIVGKPIYSLEYLSEDIWAIAPPIVPYLSDRHKDDYYTFISLTPVAVYDTGIRRVRPGKSIFSLSNESGGSDEFN
jgi:hypothetical protein